LLGLPPKIRPPAALKTGPPRSENLTLQPETAPGAGTHRAAAAGPFSLREVPLAVAMGLLPRPQSDEKWPAGRNEPLSASCRAGRALTTPSGRVPNGAALGWEPGDPGFGLRDERRCPHSTHCKSVLFERAGVSSDLSAGERRRKGT
jgi:hypothetical protein